MWRILLTFGVLHLALSQDESRSNELDQIFSNNPLDIKNIEGLKCAGVIGSTNQCQYCYTCDHPKLKSKNKENLFRLQLKDSTCKVTEVCCIPQGQLVPRTHENCGADNPEGLPRRRRPTLHSVLDREYPWRAWVYSSEDAGSPLCAASYINLGAKALLTTASCVRGRNPSKLVVRFIKTQITPNQVKNVTIHHGFDETTRSNDIAILTLRQSPGKLVHPVCVSPVLADYGTPCVSVSQEETYIYSVIPQQKDCGPSAVANTMCTTSPFYGTPEGAGVFCLDEQEKPPSYVLHGISINRRDSKSGISVFTNVASHAKWIQKTCEELQSS